MLIQQYKRVVGLFLKQLFKNIGTMPSSHLLRPCCECRHPKVLIEKKSLYYTRSLDIVRRQHLRFQIKKKKKTHHRGKRKLLDFLFYKISQFHRWSMAAAFFLSTFASTITVTTDEEIPGCRVFFLKSHK